MNKKTHILLALVISGFFLLLDQMLKHYAYINPGYTWYILNPWVGWQFFANTGIAFGIPLPQPLVIILSPLIILGLIYYWNLKKIKSCVFIYANILIVAGAISNFIDRMLFGITIDYLRIITSIFNIADIIILIGAVLLLFDIKQTKINTHSNT